MRIFGRIPGWVWGVSFTGILICAILAYPSYVDGKNVDESPDAPKAATSTATARPDPPGLRQSKLNLDKDIRAYVRAFLSRDPSMDKNAYLERIEPLETIDHLGFFMQYISTPIEEDLIERGVTVRVVIVGEIEGELNGEANDRHFDGIVPLKLIVSENDVRSILMPRTNFHLSMVESPERWLTTYFSPKT